MDLLLLALSVEKWRRGRLGPHPKGEREGGDGNQGLLGKKWKKWGVEKMGSGKNGVQKMQRSGMGPLPFPTQHTAVYIIICCALINKVKKQQC